MRGQDVIGQALGSEIALLLGHPLLQPSVGMNDECGHAPILLGGLSLHAAWADGRPSRITPKPTFFHRWWPGLLAEAHLNEDG